MKKKIIAVLTGLLVLMLAAGAAFGETVKFSRANLSSGRLLGFLVSSWRATTANFRDKNLKAVDLVGEEIKKCATAQQA